MNTPYYSKAEADQKNKETFREVENTLQSISAGEGGVLYNTLAEAQGLATKPQNGTVFQVSKITDPTNAGYYTFQSTEPNGTRFEKGFVNESVEQLENDTSKVFAKSVGKNLFDINSMLVEDSALNNDGLIFSFAGWGRSVFIPVESNTIYTLSGRTRHGVSYYSSDSEAGFISYDDNSSTPSPSTFTTPANCTHIVFNVYSDPTQNYQQTQLEKNTSASSFEPYKIIVNIKTEKLSSYLTKTDFEKFESQITDSRNSINIFDIDTMLVENSYINSTQGTIQYVSGWGRSTFIPVEPSTVYTLSGRTRQGVSYYSSDSEAGFISYDDRSSIPLTFTTPANCTHIVFNVYSDPTQNYQQTQLEKNTSASSFEPAGQIYSIKESALNGNSVFQNPFSVTLDVTGTSFINTIIGNKTLKQNLRLNNSSTGVPFESQDVFLDGNLISDRPDEAAPYRVDGSTIGANHNAGANNTNKIYKYFADGKEITDFSNNTIQLLESFKVIEFYDLLGNTTTGVIANVSTSWIFDKYGNLTIKTDYLAKQSVALVDIMFVMSNPLNGSYSNYIPKTLPFTHETISYDFSEIEDMSTFNITNRIDFTPTKTEGAGILADRVIQIKPEISFAIGYLPIKDASIANRRLNAEEKALQIASTEKIYMSAIDPAGTGTLNVGDYYSVTAYKNFHIPEANTTASYYVVDSDFTYLYLDWHQTVLETINLREDVIGKTFEIVEKSSSVNVLTTDNNGRLIFDITTKGYCILKFKN